MNMQDKEMDALFRSKLDDYEIEPSPMVWANISEELGAPGQRKSIIPMLRIAASIAVIIGVGAYFWPKQQSAVKDDPKQLANNITVKPVVNTPVNVPQTIQPAQPVNTAAPVQPVTKTQPKQVYASVQRQQAVQPSQTGSSVSQASTKASQPVNPSVNIDPVNVNTQPQQVLASAGQSQTANPVTDGVISTKGGTPVVPDIDLKGSLSDVAKTQVVNASADVPAKKHNKIRGLGGLLNAAINLVDRREDKIIEFTNNEDGDTITGINLGIVSMKKNNK